MVFTFQREELEAAIDDLIAELNERRIEAGITIVGGAAIALAYDPTREATRDVDAFYRHRPDVLDAAQAVGERRGYPPDWFNDQALAWWPTVGDPEPGTVRTSGSVTIEIASAEVLLAMKLRAVRGTRDLDDIQTLARHANIRSLDEARAVFERYYPEDPFTPRAQAAARLIEHD